MLLGTGRAIARNIFTDASMMPFSVSRRSIVEADMATLPKLSERSGEWSSDALAMTAQAKVLSGSKLEQLAVRLQRHTGRPREACWRLMIQRGIKGGKDHKRWTESQLETVREDLVKRSIEEVAKRINRTPKAIRNILRRNHLSLREIRCDLFSVESLASALHVRKAEIVFWIEQNWLQASIANQERRRLYIITPESLKGFFRHHHGDLMKRGLRNQSLFEAYVEYCFSPKHTTGEQLLDVRRDKRERSAFAEMKGDRVRDSQSEDESDDYDAQVDCNFASDLQRWPAR
jgi:hypothetical protein